MAAILENIMIKESQLNKMVLNKLYDKRDLLGAVSETLFSDIKNFCATYNFVFPPTKKFEYLYCLLYSGHKFAGDVLDVGSAKSVFPYYLAFNGYKVTTLDMADVEYRERVGKRFNVKSITHDLRKFKPSLENKFDFVTCLSVIEHIDNDVVAVENLCRYTKPGGVLFISTDFYNRYIEYPNANREIVIDRPKGSHTDSRVYDVDTFVNRIIGTAENNNMCKTGLTDYYNININDTSEMSVRGLYTFGIVILKKQGETI